MANHKRKKPKRKVKCTMCTQHRWKGNAKDRRRLSDRRALQDVVDQNAESAVRSKSNKKNAG